MPEATAQPPWRYVVAQLSLYTLLIITTCGITYIPFEAFKNLPNHRRKREIETFINKKHLK